MDICRGCSKEDYDSDNLPFEWCGKVADDAPDVDLSFCRGCYSSIKREECGKCGIEYCAGHGNMSKQYGCCGLKLCGQKGDGQCLDQHKIIFLPHCGHTTCNYYYDYGGGGGCRICDEQVEHQLKLRKDKPYVMEWGTYCCDKCGAREDDRDELNHACCEKKEWGIAWDDDDDVNRCHNCYEATETTICDMCLTDFCSSHGEIKETHSCCGFKLCGFEGKKEYCVYNHKIEINPTCGHATCNYYHGCCRICDEKGKHESNLKDKSIVETLLLTKKMESKELKDLLSGWVDSLPPKLIELEEGAKAALLREKHNRSSGGG